MNYELSELEARLYAKVTNYVTDEMNRADRLGEGQGRRRNTVGFALTILQRRLASSPAAILRSLERRQERLMARLEEARQGHQTVLSTGPEMSDDEIEDFDDLPDEEREELEDELVDEATAAATVAELEAEIQTLIGLVAARPPSPSIRHGQEVGGAAGPALRGPRNEGCVRQAPQGHHLHRVQGHAELFGRAAAQPPGPG